MTFTYQPRARNPKTSTVAVCDKCTRCVICGQPLTNGQLGHKAKYCSRDCEVHARYVAREQTPPAEAIKTCVVCNKTFTSRIRASVYCSNTCRKAAYRQKYEDECGYKVLRHIATGTMGALAELIVSADLLRQGYEVFRSVSPHASCDIIAHKDEKMLRVEVRTGHKNKSGSVHASSKGSYDCRAILVDLEEVIYEPPLETFFTTQEVA